MKTLKCRNLFGNVGYRGKVRSYATAFNFVSTPTGDATKMLKLKNGKIEVFCHSWAVE